MQANKSSETFAKNNSKWRRARTPEQQQKRRDEILQAAYELFREMDFEQISLNSIAQKARLSKTSVYLYFSTREEIFLRIFIDAFHEWIDHSVEALEKLKTGSEARDIASTWMGVTWNNSRMRALSPLLQSSIEKNVSHKALTEAVLMKIDESKKLYVPLHRLIPRMTEQDTYELLLCTFNLYSQFVAYENNPLLMEVLKDLQFSHMHFNFQAMTAQAVSMLIQSHINKK